MLVSDHQLENAAVEHVEKPARQEPQGLLDRRPVRKDRDGRTEQEHDRAGRDADGQRVEPEPDRHEEHRQEDDRS